MPDLRKREFTADRTAPHHVGDITYLPVADVSNLYLAVIDCYCGSLRGWAVADKVRTSLVQHPLTVAPRPAAPFSPASIWAKGRRPPRRVHRAAHVCLAACGSATGDHWSGGDVSRCHTVQGRLSSAGYFCSRYFRAVATFM